MSELNQYLDGLACSNEQKIKLNAYVELLREWNTKINLISRNDMGQLLSKHIAESLEFARLNCWLDCKCVLDLGTGGGLPGIPLAILFPEIQFDLLDSRKKKTMFLNQVVDTLHLTNVHVVWSRVEDHKEKCDYDVITARAVSNLVQLWSWCERLLSVNGVLITPKGRNEDLGVDYIKKTGCVEFVDYVDSRFDEKYFVSIRKNR